MDRIISREEMALLQTQLHKVVVADETEQHNLNLRPIQAPALLYGGNGFDTYADLNRDYLARQNTLPIDKIRRPFNPETPVPSIHLNLRGLPPMEETQAVRIPVQQDQHPQPQSKPLPFWGRVFITVVLLFFLAMAVILLLACAQLANIYGAP